MSYANGVHADQRAASPRVRGVVRERDVGLRGLGLGVVVAEHTAPLLNGLVVVLRIQRCVRTAVVDLHLGPRAGVARVHVVHDLEELEA